ncbi:MAG: GNAT family N-acetyltransferase [Myxococcaceae bacterium]
MVGLLDTSSAVPTVETQRLVLRGHRLADLDACCAMWGDTSVTRHIGGKAFARDEVWMRLLRYVGHWALLGYGFWVIQEKASGRFAGEVGLGDFMRDLEPPLLGTPECGWVLAPWAHGQGFATEAVRGALSWGEAHLDSSRTVCIIHPENVPSLRVAAKCGYREFRRTTYKGQPAVLFERVTER